MADLKVTQLNSIAAASVATDDVLLIVDVSAGEDKKIEPDELVEAGLSLLGTGVIDGSKIVADSITSAEIAADAITASELADNAVNADAIDGGNVHGSASPYGAGAKVHIFANSIGAADIGTGEITNTLIASNAVDAAEVVANSISGSETLLGKIHIEAGSIGAADIKNASITAAKLTGGSLIPATGIIDSDISASADIAVSKLEDFNPNAVLAGPASGATAAAPTARSLVAADLPLGTTSAAGAVYVPTGGGLSISSGAVSHSNSVTGANYGYIAFDDQGHITSGRALIAGDLPVATTSAVGGVSIGTGLSVSFGAVSLDVATTSTIGGVALSSEVQLGSGDVLELATSGVVAGTYPKVTVTDKGIVTSGTTLADTDIPNHSAALLTSGTLDIARIGANTITGAKMANDSTCIIQSTTPASGDYEGQLFLNSSSNVLTVWNGSAFVAVSAAAAIDDGTY
jgi:hypothetical protein